MQSLIYSFLMRVRPAPLAVFLKRLLGVRREVYKARRGMFYIDPISNFGHRLMKYDIYEEDIVEVLFEKLAPGKVFFDIGANEGYFTCIAGGIVGESGKVISVEPQSRLVSVVEKNADLNNLTNVKILRTAIGDIEGSVEIFLSPDVNTGSSGLSQTSKYPVQVETVKITTLQRLLETLGDVEIDLMKVDIESFEWEMILGSQEVFRAHLVKNIVIEIHDRELARRGRRAEEITEFLRSCGYRTEMRGEFHLFQYPLGGRKGR